MISGALFFLTLKLHPLTTSVDPAEIYHNIRCVHRLKRAQRVFAPSATKSKSYPLKTPQNRADEFYGYELLCTRLAGGRFHPEFTPDNSKPAPNRLKTVNGDAIYCVAVRRCRHSRKNHFQHVQEAQEEGADVRMVQGTDLR